jgi:Fe2+ transport system protein FeoA
MPLEEISTLADLPIGVEAEVTGLLGDDSLIKKRLIVMGIVPSERIRITKTAPFGDPLQVRLTDLNNSVMLRRAEAQSVGVRYER